MKKYIESLREKPEPVRKAIALFSSLGVVAVIAVIWISTLPARFTSTSQEAAVIQADTAGTVTLDSFQDQVNDLNERTWGGNTDTAGGGVDDQVVISDVTDTPTENPSAVFESPSFTIAPKER